MAVARRLARRHQVQWICGAYPGAPSGVVDGVRIRRLGAGWLGPKVGQLWFQFRLPFLAWRADYDIWVESLTPPFSTACLPWFTSRPVVALTQVLAGQAMSAKYRLPFAAVERAGLRRYRYAVATSAYLRRVLLKIQPAMRVVLIPNGVEGAFLRTARHEADRHVLFLGRLDVHQKGLDLLLEAWAREPRPSLPLVLAGAGVPRDEAWVRCRVRELGLEEAVQLPGRVDGQARHRLFGEAALFVLPSRFEASPLVLPEAFAYGLPTVMFAIPELEGYPQSCCRKVPPFDVEAFAAAVRELLQAPERRRAMGERAQQEATRYDWDRLAAQYEAFLCEIAAEAARPSSGAGSASGIRVE